MMRLLNLFWGAVLLAFTSLAEIPGSPGLIDGHQALTYIQVLASDSLQGRRSGLPGGENAAAWIAAQFQSFGLKPGVGDTSYFQPFTITTAIESGPMVMRMISPAGDTTDFRYGKDFVSFAYGGTGLVQGQVEFIGYGIQEGDKGRDDLAGSDLKGKIALALRGIPPGEGEGFWGREGGHGYKATHAYQTGAVGYLQVGDGPAMQRTLGPSNYHAELPTFWISRAACDKLLAGVGLTTDSLFARANANRQGYHLELPGRLELEAHAGIKPEAQTRNVVAYLPGADSQLGHEIVILGAHMDHLGVDAIGRVYHGADDNASGSSLVLEIAHTLARDPLPPRRSVYFCTFAGEDLGLLGSEEFVAHPPVPLDSVVAMINMDMVGDEHEGVSLGGAPNFPSIWSVWETALSDSAKARISHFKPGGYSDHAPFEEVGIPAFFVASRGDHPNYHQPEDEADSIQVGALTEVGEVVYRGLRALADYPAFLVNQQRLKDYLWQSSETVQLGVPNLPIISADDAPDLLLYEVGKGINPASRHPLRQTLLELNQVDSLLQQSPLESEPRLESFSSVPTGRLSPVVALGLASPALTENESGIYESFSNLGIQFVHVPTEQHADYFGKRDLRQAGRDRLQEVERIPLVIIWDVANFGQAQQLMRATERPLIIRIQSVEKDFQAPSIKPNQRHFILLSVRAAEELQDRFETVTKAIGRYNLGIEAKNRSEVDPLLLRWINQNYSQDRIRDLLGLNLIRYLMKNSSPKQPSE